MVCSVFNLLVASTFSRILRSVLEGKNLGLTLRRGTQKMPPSLEFEHYTCKTYVSGDEIYTPSTKICSFAPRVVRHRPH